MYVEYNKLTIYAFISRTREIYHYHAKNPTMALKLIPSVREHGQRGPDGHSTKIQWLGGSTLNTCTLRSLQVGIGVSAATGDLHGGHSEDLQLLRGRTGHLHSPLVHQAWHRRRPIHPKCQGSWPTWAHCRWRWLHALHQELSDAADRPIQHPQRQAHT